MEFILTYDGPLPSNGRPIQKHNIRRQLHPQLKELWHHGVLNSYLHETKLGGKVRSEVGGYGFTAIIHPFWDFIASLDILLLRPERSGNIVTAGGDIDNRLKTLFDALTRPVHNQDMPSAWKPNQDENPLHCLLEDDGLITSVSVRTGRLLAATNGHDVKAIIDVSIRTRNAFGGFGIVAP